MFENKPISLKDLRHILQKFKLNNVKVDLFKNFETFDKDNIILIQSDINPKEGHYVCMFKDKNGRINYFDPSGFKPLELFKKYKIDIDYQNPNKFYYYLITNNDLIDYNKFNLQKNKDSSTCALWCIYRLLNKDLNNDEFIYYIKKIKKQYNIDNYDDLIINIMNLY